MKKKHAHNVLSDVRCSHPKCEKFLKLRLVEEKPTADRCFSCHKRKEANRGHFVDSAPRKKRIEKGLPVKSF